jgi:hypothetical protein
VPYSEEEFHVRRSGLYQATLALFKRERHMSYSAMEMVIELSAVGVITTPAEIEEILELLVGRGRLYVADFDGTRYYLYDNSLGFHPPR